MFRAMWLRSEQKLTKEQVTTVKLGTDAESYTIALQGHSN